MDTLVQQCVSLVENAGGAMLYPDLLAATPYESRQRLPQALKEARNRGLLTQTVENVNGKTVHTILKVKA